MKKINLIIFSSFIFFACINTNLNSKNDIANTQIKTNDTIFVKDYSAFNKNDIGKIDTVDQYSKIKIQKFSTRNMDELVSKNKNNCFIFWAPWCKGCKSALDSALRTIIRSHQKNTNFVIISISNGLKENQKELFKLKYFMQTYVLDPTLYKSKEESNDWPIFESYLKDQFPNETFDIFVPFIMIVDNNKKIVSKDQDFQKLNLLLSK